MKTQLDLKSFEAGMRRAAFDIAAGWEYTRKTESAKEALEQFNAQIKERIAAMKAERQGSEASALFACQKTSKALFTATNPQPRAAAAL